MRIAVPVLEDVFCEHFGRGSGFFLCDVDEPGRKPGRMRTVQRPKGKCESIPDWLAQMGVTLVLAGGIGQVARNNLERLGIAVSTGHSGREPEELVRRFLQQPPTANENPCERFEHRHHHCRGEPRAGKGPAH